MLTREVEGELLILDEDHEKIHQLNSTAAFVWQLCDGSHTVFSIQKNLVEHYGIEIDVASQDVTAVLEEMINAGLIALRNADED